MDAGDRFCVVHPLPADHIVADAHHLGGERRNPLYVRVQVTHGWGTDRKEAAFRAIARNLDEILTGKEPTHEASWNAICLADFGDGGVAFVAKPQIPPRNTNWSSQGHWVHLAKIGFEKYFLRKVRKGESEPFYEKLALHALGIKKLRFD